MNRATPIDESTVNVQDELQRAKQTTLQLFLSFLTAAGMYIVMALYTMRGREVGLAVGGMTAALESGPLVILGAAMVLATVVTLFVLPRFYHPETRGRHGTSASAVVNRAIASFSIRAAVLEAVGMVGLVITFLTQELAYVVGGAIYTWLMLLVLLARRNAEFDEIQRLFER